MHRGSGLLSRRVSCTVTRDRFGSRMLRTCSKICASDGAQTMTIMKSDLSTGLSQASTVESSALSILSSLTESGAKGNNAANAIKTVTMHTTTVVTLGSSQQSTGKAAVSVMNSQARKTITQTMYTTTFNDMSHMCSGTSTLPNSSNAFASKALSTDEVPLVTATNIKSEIANDDIASVGETSRISVDNSSFDVFDSGTDITEADSNVNNALTIDLTKPTLCYDSYMNRLETCSSDYNYSILESNSTSPNSTEVHDTYIGSDMTNDGHGLNKKVGFSFVTLASFVVLQTFSCFCV